MLSANGAHIHASLGHRPRMAVRTTSAAGADQSCNDKTRGEMNRAFSACTFGRNMDTWGGASGWPTDDRAFGANHM
jgi:hypothetical protein